MLHRTADGDLTPSLGAARAEMEAIGPRPGRRRFPACLQWVSDFSDMEGEFQLIRDLTQIARQPLTFSVVQGDAIPDQWA